MDSGTAAYRRDAFLAAGASTKRSRRSRRRTWSWRFDWPPAGPASPSIRGRVSGTGMPRDCWSTWSRRPATGTFASASTGATHKRPWGLHTPVHGVADRPGRVLRRTGVDDAVAGATRRPGLGGNPGPFRLQHLAPDPAGPAQHTALAPAIPALVYARAWAQGLGILMGLTTLGLERLQWTGARDRPARALHRGDGSPASAPAGSPVAVNSRRREAFASEDRSSAAR